MKRLALALFLAVVALPLLAQQPDERVLVVYDEQELADADRAQMFALLLETAPKSWWREITVDRPQTIRTVLDDYYDYWDNPLKSADKNPFKSTVDVLQTAIQRENGMAAERDELAAGTKLRIPPVPVAGERNVKPNVPVRTRIFDPSSFRYGFVPSLKNVGRATTRDVSLAKDHAFRAARLTVIEIPHWRDAAAYLRKHKIPLPQGVLVKRPTATAKLEFLDPNEDADCPPRVTALEGSPLVTVTKAELEKRRGKIDDVVLAAEAMPLWIVDWDVDVPGGHGNKVHAVVTGVLRDLGFEELLPHVHTFDLNPMHNGQELLRTLQAYRDFNEANDNFSAEAMSLAFRTAKQWIEKPEIDPNAPAQDIDEFVLQSVFWRFLYNAPSWANFSFRTLYPQGALLHASFMEQSRSFAAVAAGNDRDREVALGSYPQVGAAMHPQLVNVTYGRPDGYVLGSRHGARVPVLLVARGCGFAYENRIRPDERGSSFATPFVAATSWVKALTEGIDPEAMRDRLGDAVTLTPFVQPMVASHGIYDPALLFVAETQQPYAILRDGTMKALTPTRVAVEFRALAADAELDERKFTVSGKLTGKRIRVGECDDQPGARCVWVKEAGKVQVYRLETISFVTPVAGVDLSDVIELVF